MEIEDLLARLRAAATASGHVLDLTTYRAAHDLFARCDAGPAGAAALAALAPEYGQPEYLASVDAGGRSEHHPRELIEDFQAFAARRAGFRAWFQPALDEGLPVSAWPWRSTGFRAWFQPALDEGERPVLLAARWLCHLAGLRHRTVQLFIDHPSLRAYTLIQVRALSRPEAPGAFDLPVAGHVAGLAPVGEALLREMEEELGLSSDGVEALAFLGACNYEEPPANLSWRNYEHRAVFRCRLAPGGLAGLRLQSSEVAAICIFPVEELVALLKRFPERIASGLRESFVLYAGRQGR
jgi:isopentenyldiphosphate isomerase